VASLQNGTFSLFPLLPKELRAQIWNYALKPSVVTLYRDRDRGRYANSKAITFVAVTIFNPSLETIPRVCAESLAVFKKRYNQWDVWDVRKSVSSINFGPAHDVLYLHRTTNDVDHRLLDEFASQYPTQAKQIQTLALPASLSSGSTSGIEILKALHEFEALKKLVIVLGQAYGSREAYQTPFLWSGMWSELSEGYGVWDLPDGPQDALTKLQKEQLPDWKVPRVSVAKFLNDVIRVYGSRLRGAASSTTRAYCCLHFNSNRMHS
jgi:hypothetical protein